MAPNGEPTIPPDLAEDTVPVGVVSPEHATANGGAPAKKVARPPAKRTARPAAKKTVKKASAKRTAGDTRAPRRAAPATDITSSNGGSAARFPRHSVGRALRIPRAILDENAGHPCSVAEAFRLLGGGGNKPSGAFNLELSSAKKYGWLDSQAGKLTVTDRAKRALRPQTNTDELTAIRDAVLAAPDISDVYSHYRGENLPEDKFFNNALVETFRIPADKVLEFREIFSDSMKEAQLVDDSSGRARLVDIGREAGAGEKRPPGPGVRTTAATASTLVDGTCFVMQPFAAPYGGYYESLFKPAIEKAGLRPVRADDEEIFGAGKIMDQVWRGIKASKVLVAELTTRNPNVYYELGMAHALGKPVVLVASRQEDIPFDLNHIRVVYYDMTDPFWGNKLIDKITENVKSAIANPEEAIFRLDDMA